MNIPVKYADTIICMLERSIGEIDSELWDFGWDVESKTIQSLRKDLQHLKALYELIKTEAGYGG